MYSKKEVFEECYNELHSGFILYMMLSFDAEAYEVRKREYLDKFKTGIQSLGYSYDEFLAWCKSNPKNETLYGKLTFPEQ